MDSFPSDSLFSGSDENNYHVHVAALASKADLILTSNSPRDFTCNPEVEPYEIITPDSFFTLVADSNPACVAPIIKKRIAYWKNKPSQLQLDQALARADCPVFAERIRSALKSVTRAPD